MKKIKILIIALILVIPTLAFSGCDEEKNSTSRDISNTFDIANHSR